MIDGTDEFFHGFPLIYKCRGFHTSLSTQYFLLEMGFNFLCYFLFWYIFTILINRKWKIKVPRFIYTFFWIGFGVTYTFFILLTQATDDQFHLKRNFDVEIFDSGLSVLENHPSREKCRDKLEDWIDGN